MFTKKIIDSDAFLDMPLSTQALYFHLNMRADDDGFVNNPKKICRMIGACEDDLKVLIAKRFVLTFETGIIVIKHWRMHNLMRKDRYNPTQYEEEYARLELKDNGSYTEKKDLLPDGNQMATTWQPDGNQMATQVRLGKDRIGKDSVDVEKRPTSEEVRSYIVNNNIHINPDRFYQYYSERNWCRANGTLIDDWKELAKQWEKNGIDQEAKKKNSFNNFSQRKYDFDALEAQLLDC